LISRIWRTRRWYSKSRVRTWKDYFGTYNRR